MGADDKARSRARRSFDPDSASASGETDALAELEGELAGLDGQFRAVFERAGIGMALLDRDACILTANPALAEMLGRTRAELSGKRLRRYARAEDRGLDRDLLVELASGARQSFEIERRYLTREHRSIVVREIVSAIPDASGTPYLLVATLHDVTEARRDALLFRSQTALSHLGEVAAVVAHEVRNALAGIRCAVEVVGDTLPEGSGERAALEEVRHRIRSLDVTVQDLLRFARPRPPSAGPVSTHRVLASIARGVEAEHGVTIEVVGEDVIVEGEEELLSSALLNLCLNAAQSLGGPGRVRVETRAQEGIAIVDIIDHGCGIPAHARDQIFEPFFTTRSRGTGLGLPIAKRIVEAHGGSIRVESRVREGTKVTIELPLALSGAR